MQVKIHLGQQVLFCVTGIFQKLCYVQKKITDSQLKYGDYPPTSTASSALKGVLINHTIPYHTIPYNFDLKFQFNSESYDGLQRFSRNFNQPYHIIPYHTIPYHTIFILNSVQMFEPFQDRNQHFLETVSLTYFVMKSFSKTYSFNLFWTKPFRKTILGKIWIFAKVISNFSA